VAYSFVVLAQMGLSDPQEAMDTALSGLERLVPGIAVGDRDAGLPPHRWVWAELRSPQHRDGVLVQVHTNEDVRFAAHIGSLQDAPDAPDPSVADAYWELTLAGPDPDTPLAIRLAGLLIERHQGVPWDEMSGFSLTLT
jgi:hypothetical protein